MDLLTILTYLALGFVGIIALVFLILLIAVLIMACKIAYKKVVDEDGTKWQKDLWKDIQEHETEE